MTICALDCGFAVLLCFVFRFIFRLVVFNFVYEFFILVCFFLYIWFFFGWSINKFIYHFIFVSLFVKRVFFCFSLCTLLVLSFKDVFKFEMWSEFFASIPEVLQPTASSAKSTAVASKADGTVRSYLGGFKRWKCWASSNHVCHFPPNRFQVAVYLQCLVNEAYSPSPVLNAVYTALTGRYSWLAYQKSSIIPWLLQWSAHVKGFWADPRSKKTL